MEELREWQDARDQAMTEHSRHFHLHRTSDSEERGVGQKDANVERHRLERQPQRHGLSSSQAFDDVLPK